MTTLSSFQDLKKIGKELEEKARAAEEERKRAQALKEKQAHDAQTFASAMSNMGVEPIRTKKRAELPHPKPAPIPRQTQAEHKAVLQASISDYVDPLTFLQSEDGRCLWRDGLPPDICKKLRRGDWTVQNHIDLHGLRVDPAREAVMQFLKASQKSGARCVRIVHGKGYGSEGGHSVLKEKVRRWLKQCDCVMAFAEAQEIDGGSGALIVLLKGLAHAPYSAPRP